MLLKLVSACKKENQDHAIIPTLFIENVKPGRNYFIYGKGNCNKSRKIKYLLLTPAFDP